MYSKVIVPLDGSQVAESILPHVAELADRLKASVVLITVATLPPEAFPESVDRPAETVLAVSSEGQQVAYSAPVEREPHVDQAAPRLEEQLKRYLATQEEPFRQHGTPISSEVLFGYPAEEIVDYARDFGADVIALASHGRSGVRGWMNGNVTDRVLRAATVPVVIFQVRGER